LTQWLSLSQDPFPDDIVDHLWWPLNPHRVHGQANHDYLITEDGINIVTEDDILMIAEHHA